MEREIDFSEWLAIPIKRRLAQAALSLFPGTNRRIEPTTVLGMVECALGCLSAWLTDIRQWPTSLYISQEEA